MRHLKAGKKLNRSPSHRWALLCNLVTSLLRHERIKTTDAKAKELRRWADRMIGLGKEGTLHARRRALGIIRDKAVVRKVFDNLAARFKDRPGGYTRVVKIGWRHGDHAPVSLIELISADGAGKTQVPAKARKTARTSARKGKEAAPKKSPAPRQKAKETSA